MKWSFFLGSMVWICSGCGDSGLTQSDVTNLPDGDATGSALSGTYEIELYTQHCGGTCGVEVQGYPVSFCDVGDKEYADLTVTQTDGHLQVDTIGDDLLVSRLSGGLYQDGSFLIGGYATHLGGKGQVATKVQGSIAEGGTIQGQVESHLWGSYEGKGIDCTQKYELSGSLKIN